MSVVLGVCAPRQTARLCLGGFGLRVRRRCPARATGQGPMYGSAQTETACASTVAVFWPLSPDAESIF